jgi:hypothetical protein
MDGRARELIQQAMDRLRAAILFSSLKDAQLALEALEDIELRPEAPSAYRAAQGGCEFCPGDGGGCCVCGGGSN